MSERKPGNVEEYLRLKGWEYRINGSEAILEQCPFCLATDYKFFINTNSFLWECKHGSCQRKGNEWVLKEAQGDKIERVRSNKETGTVEIERIPDIEKMHENLMDNQELVNWLTDNRGWSVETIIDLKIGLANRYMPDIDREMACFVYPYFAGKNCNFAKFRTIPSAEPEFATYKGFSALKGRDVPLYNSRAVKKGMDYLILTEGEADTISVLNLGETNVAGVPGAGLKKVTWDAMLDSPKKLYLLFDSDDAGQEGAKGFAERFGVERFYNIVLPEFEFDSFEGYEEDGTTEKWVTKKGKDVTEWLLHTGATLEDLQRLMEDAAPFDVEGVTSSKQAMRKAAKRMEERGTNLPKYDTPWSSLNQKLGGAEDGHLITVLAPKKTGKTTFCLNWGDYLTAQKDVNVYFECLEMDDEQLSRKHASFLTSTDDTPGKSLMTPQTFDDAEQLIKGREYEMLFGFKKYEKLDQVFARWKTIIRRYGVKVIIFDNLQLLADLIYGGERQGSRASFLSKITKAMKAFAMENKILVILIAQSKKLGDDAVANEDDLEGTSAAGNDSDTLMTLVRTKQVTIKRADDLKKQREEDTGSLDPTLYVNVGLSRFAPGGLCKLHIEGNISLVREMSLKEETEFKLDGAGRIAGIKFTKDEEKDKPAFQPPAHAVALNEVTTTEEVPTL